MRAGAQAGWTVPSFTTVPRASLNLWCSPDTCWYTENKPSNVLLLGAADVRHILQTMGLSHRAPSRDINVRPIDSRCAVLPLL